ncbi:hypothetical protein BDM02DRAFT_3181521 [Thelephora ganbajun]|uniref:Uncharacterized protein n=2 Tax=Thelephora ganbajun TaxID=370292 RepID=A0ACB6Z5Y9_THEGA|nr:hypothetical protein BDM02DRAFT_3181919 [Thelephora ganbajun]KAF9644566.1 hypothetical protein BDM02DRAFT_3181521 [Thelephora ganbajun]
MTATTAPLRLSEEFVQECFHSYLKSSLTQAKVERLVDTELLSSAEGDLMITGPALCLYFAALRCTTDPPSVPLPRRRSKAGVAGMITDLSENNCPVAFLSFLRVWADAVPRIQGLVPEHQHDLARIICGLNPLSSPNPALNGIAADLRAVAIEISQRRTFQNRYAEDLQAALDAGMGSGGLRVTASFVPPPVYDATPPRSPPISPPLPPANSPYESSIPPPPLLDRSHPSTPAISIIRETLYAALADVIERSPSIRRLMKSDPPRAYFAAVAFAILDVATTAMTPDGSIRAVMGQNLTLEMCPRELKPFMMEFVAIGSAVREWETEDNADAIEIVSRGGEPPEPRMERTKKVLENGVGYNHRRQRDGEDDGRVSRRSVQGRAVTLANRINALALGMTRLKAFRDRQNDVFSVLAGLGS